MGIESLNSAAAAAGVAMVSDDDGDTSASAVRTSFAGQTTSSLPAVISSQTVFNSASRSMVSPTISFGERMTGLLDAWRPKG